MSEIIIPNRNGTTTTIIDHKLTLDEMQAIVGGLIEIAYETEQYQLVVNEEGLPKDLEPNTVANGFRPFAIIGARLVGDALVLVGDGIME